MSENKKFEKELQEAFRDAEFEPDGRVWTGIELELEKAAAQRARKQLKVFQWLAAASLALAVGITGIYVLSDKQSIPDARETTQPQASLIDESPPVSGLADDKHIKHSNPSEKPNRGSDGMKRPRATDTRSFAGIPDVDTEKTSDRKETLSIRDRKTSLSIYEVPKPAALVKSLKIDLPENSPDPGQVLLAKLADEERKLQQKEKKSVKEKWWTSVGFGAGTFNPNVSSPQPSFSMNSVRMPVPSQPSSGLAYSVGAQVGYRLAKRWVIQGGLAYLNQQASYASSIVMMETSTAHASLNEFVDHQENLIVTAPYEVTASLQYMSVPVQAGFVVFDGSLALLINGGVATDFFVQSVLTPEFSGYNRTVITPGMTSPYRPVYFSGVAGTELSYRFGEKYRIALAPGVRYALQSVYKSDMNNEVLPITYDVSFRFRYLFR
ncbi:MAG: hypothetical protein RMK43_09860 [Cyclobacteriaceae bacterium]|nr:hypothetical protein [Cyclobacteriaceae bacterium]